MKKQQIKAFTLVELIIVITILAILATIGFMSFQSYTLDARDGKRKRDLASIRSGLEMYQAKKAILPMPDNYATLSSGTTIGYQGYAGTSVLSYIKASSQFQDPTDNKYYTYGISSNQTSYQLLAMLEQNPNATSYNDYLLNQTYALDYTNRYSYTLGQGIEIYLSGTTKLPVQEGNSGTTVTVNTANISIVTSNASNVSGGTGGGGGSTTYAISTCPSPNTAQGGTSPTKATILANINNYIGCNVTGGQIAGYTYSGSSWSSKEQMVLISATTDTAGASTTQWGLLGTDLLTLENITSATNTVTMTGNIVSWDGLSNTQKVLTQIGATESLRAAQICDTLGAGVRYLPATEELNQLYCYSNIALTSHTYYLDGVNHANCVGKGYISRNIGTLSSFIASGYWSSTEYSATNSRYQNFSYYGYRNGTGGKTNAFAVRCVSRF